MRVPVWHIEATAPVRICDIGGWTDTWFAGSGAVCNLAVSPRARVTLVLRGGAPEVPRVVLDVADFGERYSLVPGRPLPGRHPLLEATLDVVGVPHGSSLEISVHCDAPAGASVGTSAAVTVALAGALTAARGNRPSPSDVATVAHRVEVDRLGLQSGVQDQYAAAAGGINCIHIPKYPEVVVEPIQVSPATWGELDRRLVLVFLGRPHVSSAVHEQVIAELTREGGASARLQALRDLVPLAKAALEKGDLAAFAEVMRANTEAQRQLHPGLVSADAEALIELATAAGATGWKVNGAGGDGGSLTLLCPPEPAGRSALVEALATPPRPWKVVPVRLSRDGLRVRRRRGDEHR